MTANRTQDGISKRKPVLTVHPAMARHAPAILELTVAMGYQCSLAEIRSRLDTILGDDDNTVFVACHDATVVGWVHVFVARRLGVPEFAEIGGIVTLQQYRHRGVGRLLVAQCESWARHMNLSNLRGRCNTQRREAHAFYENSAFVGSKDQTVFIKRL